MVEMLIAYSEKRANSNQVLRALMSHRGWFVPLGLFAISGEQNRKADSLLILSPENLVPAGQLWVFTDAEAAHLATAKGASLGAYAGGMRGTELFQIIDPALQQCKSIPVRRLNARGCFQVALCRTSERFGRKRFISKSSSENGSKPENRIRPRL